MTTSDDQDDGERDAARAHLDEAERAARARVAAARHRARPVQSVAVVGAGTMGATIARALVEHGFTVALTDADTAVAEQAAARIAGVVPGAAVAVAGFEPAVAAADLVVEAVFEDLAVKEDLFRRLDAVAAPGTVLATNTSYLDVDRLAAATSRPADVVGTHFFVPAHRIRLLEVVQGTATDDDTLATALDVADRMGKLAVVVGNADGFVGNRILFTYRRQCELMLEEGALPEQVDGALTAFGYPMGPFAVADLSGLDVGWRNRRRLDATRDPAERYVVVADRLVEAGRLGRKTGAGWFRYEDGRTPLPDPEVTALVEAAAADEGVVRRPFTDAEIVERVLLAMANEAQSVVDDGVAASPGDVDLVMVTGYGFPRDRGGPLWWAAGQDPAWLAGALARLAEVTGPGFRASSLAGRASRPDTLDGPMDPLRR